MPSLNRMAVVHHRTITALSPAVVLCLASGHERSSAATAACAHATSTVREELRDEAGVCGWWCQSCCCPGPEQLRRRRSTASCSWSGARPVGHTRPVAVHTTVATVTHKGANMRRTPMILALASIRLAVPDLGGGAHGTSPAAVMGRVERLRLGRESKSGAGGEGMRAGGWRWRTVLTVTSLSPARENGARRVSCRDVMRRNAERGAVQRRAGEGRASSLTGTGRTSGGAEGAGLRRA